jgi:hypothetical protein
MSGQTGHIDNQSEALKKSMEEYRQQLIKEDNFKEGSKEFESLMALHKYFEVTPKEEQERILRAIEESGVGSGGPTVEEYFESLNPRFQYVKGYQEGATKFKDFLIEKFKSESPLQLKGIDVNGNPVFIEIDKFSREQIIQIIQEVYENN